jgi:hypothetical protein
MGGDKPRPYIVLAVLVVLLKLTRMRLSGTMSCQLLCDFFILRLYYLIITAGSRRT